MTKTCLIGPASGVRRRRRGRVRCGSSRRFACRLPVPRSVPARRSGAAGPSGADGARAGPTIPAPERGFRRGRRRGRSAVGGEAAGRPAPPAAPLPPVLVSALATIAEVATSEEATSRPKRFPVSVAAAAIARCSGAGIRLHGGTSVAPGSGRTGRRSAPRARRGRRSWGRAGGVGAFELEHPLERQQLGVDPLQLGRLAGQHVHPHVVADRHLVEGAAEVGLHHRELLQQAVALGTQLGVLRPTLRLGLAPVPAWLSGLGLRGASSAVDRPAQDLAQRLMAGRSARRAGASLGSPPTTITSGRFCCALM